MALKNHDLLDHIADHIESEFEAVNTARDNSYIELLVSRERSDLNNVTSRVAKLLLEEYGVAYGKVIALPPDHYSHGFVDPDIPVLRVWLHPIRTEEVERTITETRFTFDN